MARTFLSRDVNTKAWDGEYLYVYTDDKSAFIKAFTRLHTAMSPILKVGNFKINVI